MLPLVPECLLIYQNSLAILLSVMEITTPVVNHGEEEEKFDVRIVLYKVPFQIKFEVILTNGYRDIDLGSWPKKRSGKMQTICR